jgi:D-3-phosphoglycerate dehydrogenase
VAFDPFLSAEAAAELGVGKVTLDQLLERSDYITIHTPLIPATRHLLGADAFAKVKPGVFLVHCARGGIVDEAALLEALDAGRVAGAALDVFETEPLPVDHPLRSHPKVVLTPHLGASTDEAQEAVATQIAEQVVAYFADGTLTNAVNAWSLSGDKQRALAPYLDLAARLGALAGQVHTGALEDVEVRFVGGPAAAERTPLVATLLSELMRVRVGAEVNPISARAMAADLGIALTVGTADDNAEFHNLIEVRVRGGGKASEVQGVVFGKQGCRVTSVDGYRMDLAPAGRILLVKNDDLPGIIGAVGGLLGDRGINVSGLVVGTKDGGGAALALWSVDQEVPAELVASLQRRPGIREVRTIRL